MIDTAHVLVGGLPVWMNVPRRGRCGPRMSVLDLRRSRQELSRCVR
ncbi:hypothetical protein FrEUN1fDRAFT_7335 [Parafrankia sp. EUN1f]|nr:hypothetical protein FrEUN1fDRAFT_7335 [Parafrankia sp. EUN1f]